jgi:hypothetical protein
MNPDIPWAAGLFEGEGSILIAPPRNNRPGTNTPYMSMGSVDRDVLERFATVAGGKVYGPYQGQGHKTPEHWKPIYQWRLHGVERVQLLLREFWPYLGERRRAKAADAIASYYESERVPQRRNTLAYQ